MSKAIVCDNCDQVLVVNDNGDDADGESAAWLTVVTTFGKYDLCSRSCVHTLVMEDEDFALAYEAGIESIVALTRTIKCEE